MRFTLNGRAVEVKAPPMARLLDVLRDELRLTGTKEGCGEGECGACTVLVDGAPVNACLVPIAQVRGAKVTTIEGLEGRHPLQAAFIATGGTQCGICTPGMILAACALGPKPDREAVREGLAGNLCRCTGYEGIYRAIEQAGKTPGRERKPAGRGRKGAGRGRKAAGQGGKAAGRKREAVRRGLVPRRRVTRPRRRR